MSPLRLLATGFGPFPGAPENPTEPLMWTLAGRPAEEFGAGVLRAVVLETDYRRSWGALRRLYSSFAPDVVVHFGLSAGSDAIHIECVGRNSVDLEKPDASGTTRSSASLASGGPETLPSTFPAKAILKALRRAGFPAALSRDAGLYVCNATLYRSLLAAPPARRVGFVHVPHNLASAPGLDPSLALLDAALIVLKVACRRVS